MRKSNQFSKPLFLIIVTLLAVFAMVGTQLAFGTGGILSARLVATTVFNRHWLILNILKIFSEVVFAGLIVFVARLVTSKNNGVGQFVRQWMLVGLSGLLMTIWLVVKWRTPLYTASYFDAILPIIRNYVPAVSGLLLATAFASELKNLTKKFSFRICLYFLLAITTLAGRDLLGASNGLSISGILLIFTFGLANMYMATRPKMVWVVLGPAIATVSLVVMVPVSLGLAGSLKLCAQFAGQMSPLILVSAASLVNIVVDRLDIDVSPTLKSWSVGTIIISLLVVLNWHYDLLVKDVTAWVKTVFGQRFGIWMIIVAAIVALTVAVFTLLLQLLLHPTWVSKKSYGEVAKKSAFEVLEYLRAGHFKQTCLALCKQYLPGAAAFVSLWVSQNISTLLMNEKMTTVEHLILSHQSIFEYTIFKRAATMLFGTLILYALFAILRALTNRYWVSILLTQFIALGWAIGSRIKIMARSEPITIGDMYEVRAISELMGMVSPWVVVGAVIAIVVLIVAIVYLERKHRIGAVSFYPRIVMLICALVFLAGFRNINHQNSFGRNIATSFRNSPSIINQMLCAQNNGPILQFINGMDVEVMPKPKGYSKAEVLRVVKKYQKEAQAINSTRQNNIKDMTVIFNLSESFSDPTRMPNLKVNKDPLPNIRAIKQQATSGLMMSFGYGGGTANMEWESLTGNALGNLDTGLSTPYTQMVTKLKQAPSINQYFNYSAGIHPYLGTFYGRSDAYVKFGFNKFEYLGSKYKIKHQKKLGNSNYLSDYTAYANTLDQLKSHKSSQFINLVTMQNHMPFTAGTYNKHDFHVTGTAYGNGTGKAPLESYIQGLNYTDKEVAKFKQAIDKINRPIIWVWYGDHLAALYSGDNLPQNTVVMHMTDYFVYANKYAREHGAKTKNTDNTNVIGAKDFGALAFDQANAKVDGYMALTTQVQQKLPTIWSKVANSPTNSTEGMRFVQNNGTRAHYQDLTAAQRSLLHDYQIIQYDIDAGKQYSLKDGMVNSK